MTFALPLFVFEPYVNSKHDRQMAKPSKLLSYLDAKGKRQYQQQISERIRPYLMNYISRIQEEITASISGESLAGYLANLHNAWQQHNKVNETIDWFLCAQRQTPFKDWSLREWELARELFVAAIKVDHRKNTYSGGIKRKVDREVEYIKKKFLFGADDMGLLLTCATGTFHVIYYLEHAEYYVAKTENGDAQSGGVKIKLADKYHCGDEELLDIRMLDLGLGGFCEVRRLKDSITEMRAILRQFWVDKIYFMLERRPIKELDQLLEYDNLTEYLWVYNLKGFPDVVLRDEICRRLKLAHRLPEAADALSLDSADLIYHIDSYIQHRKYRYLIRMRPYWQNYGTCGTCCVLSILGKVGIMPTLQLEWEIWNRVGRPYNFPGGMAKILIENGFKTRYYQYPAKPFTPEHEDVLLKSPFMDEKIQEYVNLHREARRHKGLGISRCTQSNGMW